MIYAYGVTQQGAYHIKNNVVCQDAHKIIKCSDNMVIAAVADGLGSEEHSDVASKTASEFSTEYCSNHIKSDSTEEEILEIIKDSFELSQNKIEQIAMENGHDLDQYDTTLSLAILIDDCLYYGHSGDSGIIAMTTDGKFCKVTEQQRDSEGRVLPLFFGEEKWIIRKYDNPVVSVFLATDGMYEILFPVYIRDEDVSIYAALAKFFMEPKSLKIEAEGEGAVQEKISKFMGNISAAQVNDDKTVAVIMNTDTSYSMQPAEYYAEPDWPSLKKKYEDAWKRAAYPHLYKDEDKKETKETVKEEQPATEISEGNEVDNADNTEVKASE